VTALAAALPATRITFRLHRFELVAFSVLTALGFGLAFLVAARLDAIGYGAECVDAMRAGGLTPESCEFKANLFYGMVNREAGPVGAILLFVPYLAALMLGVAVVGREVERGTTRLAWALTPSRMTWLAQRLVPVLVGLLAIGLVAGIAADRLLAATEPGIDPANALSQFGQRGPVFAARIVFVFAIAVVVGAMTGRALPALIVAGLVAVVGIAGGTRVHDTWIASEALPIEQPSAGDRWIDQRFRAPDGRLITWQEMEQIDPPPTDPESTQMWPTMPEVMIGIPGTRYLEISMREIGALAGATLVALAGTAIVVRRRRPG
jgi:hypothetical protein